MCIEESLTSKVGNNIYFANDILKNQKRVKGEHNLYYSMKMYKKMGSFNIFNNISEHLTLIKLMDSIGNANHAISVVGYWIFESNYEKELVLNRE